MIQVEQHGPITSIRMARSFLGKPLYWTTAYWVDGLLIDTGPRCAAPELVRILQQVQVEGVHWIPHQAQTYDLQIQGCIQPFLSQYGRYERPSYGCQAQHHREDDKGAHAQQFPVAAL